MIAISSNIFQYEWMLPFSLLQPIYLVCFVAATYISVLICSQQSSLELIHFKFLAIPSFSSSLLLLLFFCAFPHSTHWLQHKTTETFKALSRNRICCSFFVRFFISDWIDNTRERFILSTEFGSELVIELGH